jgi:hypothetical protein
MYCHSTPLRLVHSKTAREVSSVPLSLTIIADRLRRAISAPNSRTTRVPPIEVTPLEDSVDHLMIEPALGLKYSSMFLLFGPVVGTAR